MKAYYQENGQTIYCGDCLEIIPEFGILPKLSNYHRKRIPLILTDPPYGVGYAGWDEKIPPLKWLEMCRAGAETVILTPGNGNQYDYPKPTWTLCWFRPGSIQLMREGGGFSHWEPILLYGKNFMRIDAKQFNAQTGEGNSGHPCTKPESVWRWLMSNAPGEEVLDPFMGSGTTLVVAKNLGRKAIGIEINERYCEIAANRLRQSVMEF